MRPESAKEIVSDEDIGARKTTSEKKDKEAGGKNEMPHNSKKHTVPFHKLFSFADSTDVILMILGTLGAMGNGISPPIMTVLYGNLIQSFGGSPNNVLDEVTKISLKLVCLAIGSGIASFLQVSCWMATGERQSAQIRNLYLKTILRQEIAFFDKEANTGKVVERLSGDTVLIQEAMGEKVGTFIKLMSTFIGAFMIALLQGWRLALVMLCTLPPMVLAGGITAIVMSRMTSKQQAAYEDAAIAVEETIGSIRTVASFTGEKQVVEKYAKSLVKAYKASVQQGLAAGLGVGALVLVVFMGYSLGVWYGAKLILHKGYTGGKVINVLFAITTGSSSLGQIAPCMTAFASGQAAAYKMFETINRKPEIDAYVEKGKKILDDIQGEIEFRDVHFSYPARPYEQIFRGFSLCIQKGTTVAFVGESGSGKSTVISLIERFYDPQAGEILIDGTNLKEFQLRWIRGKIGLVSQEPVLFATSIRDNIAYGKDKATDEEIRAATKLANAAKFIDKLPQGLDTLVGEHGTQLSGGQKQRIAIARAILKNPRILLLDEATSALDAESERIVQEALDRVMANRTTVIVAHRLSTIRNAESIAVIHRGTIVEKGSHNELLDNPDGAYSQLIRLQEANTDADNINKLDSAACTDLDLRPSKHSSSDHSVSRRSSSRMQGSRRNSFQAPLGGLPGGVDAEDFTSEDPEAPTKKRQAVPLRRLAYLNKPELPVLILGSFAAIAAGLVFPVLGLLLSNVIKSFYEPPQKLRKDSNLWALIFLLFGLLSCVTVPCKTYLFGVAGSKLIQRIRLMTFQNVVNMEVEWFDNTSNSSGAIGARLSSDSAIIRSLVGDALALLVQNATTLVAGLVIAFIANWQLSLIILVLLPLLGLNGYVQVKSSKGFSKDAKKMYEEASQVASDAVGSIRTVASFSAEEKVIEIYKQKCEGPTQKGIKQGIISGAGFGLSFFFLFCFYAISFYVGALLVKSGKTSFDKVFRVFFALAMAALGISQSSSMAPDTGKAKAATASVFAILDRKSKINPTDDSGLTIERLTGNIKFKHVSFRYPMRPDIQIFQDLCLTIQSGKTVALVGESGSGKSTVISLLQRFYNPDSGEIFLDGIEIRKLQLRWLRQQMGLVSQEPALFNDTIRANIAYGKEGSATEAEIIAAAELSNAHRFISSQHKGYDTVVGGRGGHLSGGQKQRIAIARAMVKDPRILLLDEATSALDAESERTVQEALDRVMVNRTTVVVAHRLLTVRGADAIAVVKNGVIAEMGNHETLMKNKDGPYASLVALHMTAAS